jgi:hypothetical protein
MGKRNSKILMICPAPPNSSASHSNPATRPSPFSIQNGSFVTNESRLPSMEVLLQRCSHDDTVPRTDDNFIRGRKSIRAKRS